MKSTKNATIRIPEDLYEYLTRNNKSINQAIISEINTLKRIRIASLGEIKNIFSPQEWFFLADVFNRSISDEIFRANTGALIAACEDAERFEGTASKNGVYLPDFVDKIKKLSSANIEAIISRIEDYIENSDSIKIEEWSNY